MEDRKPQLKQALGALIGQRRAEPDHPDLDAWVAYREGRTEPARVEALQEHLAGCRRCTAQLLDLDAFEDPQPGKAGTVSSFEQAAVRRLVEKAIREAPAASAGSVAATSKSLAWRRAAMWLLVLGLGAWTFDLRQDLGAKSEALAAHSVPSVNPQIHYLEPDASNHRGRDAALEVELPGPGENLILVLHADPVAEARPDYGVELRAPSGEIIWKRRGLLRRAPSHSFALRLPSSILEAGRYEITLLGLSGEQRETLATYKLQVVEEGS